LEARIKREFPGTDIELVRSSGGVFEVSKDGALIYSKRQTGLHPTWEDLVEKLR
jgi:selT/selW/selH-like putative selenoprotein